MDRGILTYFKNEKKLLAVVTVTGLFYNIGMIAGPYFEGQLAQYLFDLLKGQRTSAELIRLSVLYVLVIACVQGARFLKRLYVRKFANHVTRAMKVKIYDSLLAQDTVSVRRQDAGTIMTKAIQDAESCAEGMRKFTTEVFDTGVVMIAYLGMLLYYDWRLTLISMIFPPMAYAAAERIKARVTAAAAKSRESLSRLNAATADRISNALTYRTFGEETNRGELYERHLSDYERKNIVSGIYDNSTQPVYLVISLVSTIPILYFGGRNVSGTGWSTWTIASFTTFLSCFLKLATKSSHAAKLFNAVQKAEVSWKRIRPYLEEDKPCVRRVSAAGPDTLDVEGLGASVTENGKTRTLFSGISFTLQPGQILGITGPVGCGKSLFGQAFLNEIPLNGTDGDRDRALQGVSLTGSILYGGRNIHDWKDRQIFAYEGHDPELLHDTVRNNITLGRQDEKRLREVMEEVQLAGELSPDTQVGEKGSGISGGQAARIGLARALFSNAPVVILDDPFASVDAQTERHIFEALRRKEAGRSFLIPGHRLALFPQMDGVLILNGEESAAGSHEEVLRQSAAYRELISLQKS